MQKLIDINRPIPFREMPPEAQIAYRAHQKATRKMRKWLRMHGLPMIIWKDGRVQEVPA